MAIYVAIDVSDYNDGYYSYSYYDDYYSDGDLDWIGTIIPLEQAILSFTVLLLLVHFTLFVRACVETHQYNRATRTIFVPMPVAPYGYPPPGPPMQQYPYAMQPAPPPQMAEPPRAPDNVHHYGYYAPPGAVEAPSSFPHDHQRGSTVSTTSPPPGQHRSVSPGTNSDYQRT